ncbi:glycosyl transferase family 21-domain-containing protein [Lipomyces arxii]|uniref:glycosyl transferase family 21-domain-containing protein n=1 Tax=Lipomyces arxii TaxID=56418 RepID=UPI0034CEA74F
MPSAVYVFVNVLLGVFLAWYALVCLVCSIGYYTLKTKFTKLAPSKSSQYEISRVQGVTILRPLKGIDAEFEACISSAFEQDYPKFEVILSVEEPSDPAVVVVKRIMAQYPNVPSRLIIGAAPYGVNPKVNNLIRGYEEAMYDLLWVFDSNCWLTSGALGRAVDVFEQNPIIKLVHHLPLCVDISGRWGSRLDEMFLATAHAKFYSAINTVAIAPCVTGKSNLFRKSDLNKVEPLGIKGYAKYIAEDQQIGDGLWQAGGRHAMTGDAAIQPVGSTSLSSYFFRRMRWLRVRKYLVRAATLVEPMTESILCGVMGATALHYFFCVRWWLFFWLHILFWAIGDYWIYSVLHRHDNVEFNAKTPYFARPKSGVTILSWTISWIGREVLALPIWIIAMYGTRIEWRNRLFYILPDATAAEIKS